MLLVIFGAGASFDSSPDMRRGVNDDQRIPLADELFASRQDIAINWLAMDAILPYLRHRTDGVGVESALEELRGESAGDPERVTQLMAVRFYLQHVVSAQQEKWSRLTKRVTNYLTLFDELRRLVPAHEAIGIVTYNYDTMVETALQRQGMLFDSFAAYTNHPRWRLFKIHGSVDWARRAGLTIPEMHNMNAWQIAEEIIRRASEVDTAGQLVMWRGGVPIAADTHPLIPAIAVPFRDKQNFEFPAEHESELKRFLPEVTRVLVIGWKAADPPFLNMIREADPAVERLIVVSDTDPSSAVANFNTVPLPWIAAADASAQTTSPAFVPLETTKRKGGFSEYIVRKTIRADLT